MYTFVALCIKSSILFLYRRLFDPTLSARVMIWIGFALIVPFYTASIVGLFILCAPRRHEKLLGLEYGSRCTMPVLELSFAQGLFGVLSDFYLLAVPITQVLKLSVSLGRKIGLAAIFMTGLMYVTS